MTPKECTDLELIAKSPSRRRSVALGSGRTQEQVNVLNCSVTGFSDAYAD
jgi:signal recognition particle GTPase